MRRAGITRRRTSAAPRERAHTELMNIYVMKRSAIAPLLGRGRGRAEGAARASNDPAYACAQVEMSDLTPFKFNLHDSLFVTKMLKMCSAI
eukprot:COSAG02_NODE_3465_length_6695_cov_3.210734_6_plen_91_part_00